MNRKKITRLFTLLLMASAAILSISSMASAQSICNNFANTCNVPTSLTTYTISDSLLGMTGEAGEPQAWTGIPTSSNPLQTTWYHWIAPQSGMGILNTQGTNPSAIAPSYITPYVIDTTIAVYTGLTLGTLTRVGESNDWAINTPPNSNCTQPRILPESFLSSCTMFPVVAGTRYHFQVDKLSETDPANNNLLLNFRLVVPTAADISVSGRAMMSSGEPIKNARITLINTSTGTIQFALTNQFGSYVFNGLDAGGSYIISAESKRFIFSPESHTINPSDDITGLDFIAEDGSEIKRE